MTELVNDKEISHSHITFSCVLFFFKLVIDFSRFSHIFVGYLWWYSSTSSPARPPTAFRPPGNLHRVLACTARAESWDELVLLLFLYKSSELGQSGAPWPSLEHLLPGLYLPGKCQNYTAWEALELYGCCQDTIITWCKWWSGWWFTDESQSSQNSINSGNKWGPLSSSGLQQAAPCISLWVGCFSQHFELWSLRLPGLNYRDPSLFEAQLLSVEENHLKWVVHFRGIFNWYLYIYILSVCMCVCVNQFKSYYCDYSDFFLTTL